MVHTLPEKVRTATRASRRESRMAFRGRRGRANCLLTGKLATFQAARLRVRCQGIIPEGKLHNFLGKSILGVTGGFVFRT